jgi:hypothetical protein
LCFQTGTAEAFPNTAAATIEKMMDLGMSSMKMAMDERGN